jgi:hypothetical protein
MTIDDLVSKGWDDHAADAEGVFARFPQGIALATSPGGAVALAGLITHVAGEHLGRFDDGIALLERLAASAKLEPASPEARAIARSQAALHLAAGRRHEAERLEERGRAGGAIPPASDRIRIFAVAASALAGRGLTAEAAARFDEALALASYGPTKDDPAARALAVTGNNLAAALEERPSRTPLETDLMVLAAETGLRFWSIAGGWVEIERAHYRLSNSLRLAGHAERAVRHARECLRIVLANGADPFESFHARDVLARALRAYGDAAGSRRERDAAAALVPALEPDAQASAREALATLDHPLVTP